MISPSRSKDRLARSRAIAMRPEASADNSRSVLEWFSVFASPPKVLEERRFSLLTAQWFTSCHSFLRHHNAAPVKDSGKKVALGIGSKGDV